MSVATRGKQPNWQRCDPPQRVAPHIHPCPYILYSSGLPNKNVFIIYDGWWVAPGLITMTPTREKARKRLFNPRHCHTMIRNTQTLLSYS